MRSLTNHMEIYDQTGCPCHVWGMKQPIPFSFVKRKTPTDPSEPPRTPKNSQKVLLGPIHKTSFSSSYFLVCRTWPKIRTFGISYVSVKKVKMKVQIGLLHRTFSCFFELCSMEKYNKNSGWHALRTFFVFQNCWTQIGSGVLKEVV